MKLLVSILAFIGIIFYHEVQAQFDLFGNILKEGKNILKNSTDNNIYEFAVDPPKWDSIRKLKELNDTLIADAYPWISYDGLRLYFTKEQSQYDKIYTSSRKYDDLPFEDAKTLEIGFDDHDIISCWLTNDELDIYIVIRDSELYTNFLYHAQRNNILDKFSNFVKVELTGFTNNFFSAPSLTQDMNQLYIFTFEDDYEGLILMFEKENNYSYKLSDTLSIPEGLIVGSGQISKDGLKYFLTLAHTDLYHGQICFLSRNSILEDFTEVSILSGAINDTLDYGNLQPSITGDENTIIFVKNNTGYWSSNDLFIAHKTNPNGTFDSPIPNEFIKLNHYPNPVKNEINIDYFTQERPMNNKLIIYNLYGKIVFEHFLTGYFDHININTSGFDSGIYFYRVISTRGVSPTNEFIICK